MTSQKELPSIIIDGRDGGCQTEAALLLASSWAEIGLLAAVLDAPAGDDLNILASRHGVARIWRDAKGPDGVLISDGAEAMEWRRQLGQKEVLGVQIGNSRHQGMLAAESGADFVLLDEQDHGVVLEYAQWWCGLMNLALAIPHDKVITKRLMAEGLPDMVMVPAGLVLEVGDIIGR